MNTLFLSLFVSKDGFQQGASSEILRLVLSMLLYLCLVISLESFFPLCRTVFMAVPLLQYVFLVVGHDTNIGETCLNDIVAESCC